MKKNNGWSLSQIKVVGAAAMLIDHAAVVFFDGAFLLRAIGRTAFPIFAFALVEGFFHTHSRARYLLRLCALAFASEWLFDRLFYGKVFWLHQNTVFTLAFGLAAMCLTDALPRPLSPLPWTGAFFAAWICRTDYGAVGILLLWLLWAGENSKSAFRRSVSAFAVVGAMEAKFVGLPLSVAALPLFSVAAVLPVCCCTGSEKKPLPLWQWGFYLWYPGHLAALLLAHRLVFGGL